MSRWLKHFIKLAIIVLIASPAWAGPPDQTTIDLSIPLVAGAALIIMIALMVFLRRLLKGLRKVPLSSQTGSTRKINVIALITK